MRVADAEGTIFYSSNYKLNVGCPTAAATSIVMDFADTETFPSALSLSTTSTQSVYPFKFTSAQWGSFYCTITAVTMTIDTYEDLLGTDTPQPTVSLQINANECQPSSCG